MAQTRASASRAPRLVPPARHSRHAFHTFSQQRDMVLTQTHRDDEVRRLLEDALVAVDDPVGDGSAHRRLAHRGDDCMGEWRRSQQSLKH